MEAIDRDTLGHTQIKSIVSLDVVPGDYASNRLTQAVTPLMLGLKNEDFKRTWLGQSNRNYKRRH